MKRNHLKILITGSSGLIGGSIYNYLAAVGHTVCGVDLFGSQTTDVIVDILDRDALLKCLGSICPDIIIHCAGIKDLVTCEENKERAWNTNVESSQEIVLYANRNDVKIIFISSDVVFDGAKGDYKENDLPNPINWYGKTKYHSELLFQKIGNHAICRTALVLGPLNDTYKNYLADELDLGVLSNQSLLPYFIYSKLVNDEELLLSKETVSSPIHVDLLSQMLVLIIEKDLRGVFHCTGSEPISRLGFAFKIADHYGLSTTSIKNDTSRDLLIRPKNLSMGVDDTYSKLGLSIDSGDIKSLIIRLNLNTTVL